MEERTTLVKARSINRLVVYGIVGFGIGGAIGGTTWVAFDAPHIGFAIWGALGGASLCLNRGDWKRTVMTAFACAIGVDFGYLFPFFVSLIIWEPTCGQGFFLGCIGGAISGASLALGLKEWRRSWLLALAGAIGFGVASQATWDTLRGLEPQVLWGAIRLLIWGTIGGASLGAALGYIDKKNLGKKS